MIATHLTPVSVDVATGMVAAITILAALVFALATLARPSGATVTWGAAFGLGMLAAYLWLAADHNGVQAIRGLASGLLLCFEPLVWSGLRRHLGARPHTGVVVGFGLLICVLLMATSDTAWYLPVFHVGFIGSGAFAALVAFELIRATALVRDIVLPLIIASSAFTVVSVVSGVSALQYDAASTSEQLSSLRGINGVGTVVVSICAAFTLILLVRADTSASPGALDPAQSARRRLQRAEEQHDHGWSVLDVRLDDPADLREASTGPAFAAIVDRFHRDVEAALPAGADIERVEDGRALVLIPGSDEAVRHHIREILGRVSVIDAEAPVRAIRASASIGWATASVVGHDYDALLTAAARAALLARQAGGDGWKRAVAPGATASSDEAHSTGFPTGATTLEG